MTLFLFLFFLCLAGYGFLIDYYRRAWKDIPLHHAKPLFTTSVSVVIAVRNEEKNVPILVDFLAAQDYPKHLFEVILVDDHSEDGTVAALRHLPPGFSFFSLPGGEQSKKKAIAAGIAAARGDLIVTTDADCTMGKEWISALAGFYEETGASFIAAPVCMRPGNAMSSIFQGLDFLGLQGITGAAVHRHLHTLCNGANLAYPRRIFMDVGGFEGIDSIPSGDDMLLMYKIFERDPSGVRYLKAREAIVQTQPEPGWRSFLNQRIRWSSKAVHYRDKRVFYILLLVYAVNICFLVLGVAACVDAGWLGFLVLFLTAKVLIEYPFVNAVAIFFGQQHRMRYFALMQPLHIAYTIVAGWLGRFGSYRWKSRLVKNTPAKSAKAVI